MNPGTAFPPQLGVFRRQNLPIFTPCPGNGIVERAICGSERRDMDKDMGYCIDPLDLARLVKILKLALIMCVRILVYLHVFQHDSMPVSQTSNNENSNS